MQHTIQECTFDLYVFGLKIPYNTDRQQSTQRGISPNWSPSLKEVYPMDLFKPFGNISSLESFNLTLGASLNLKNPFCR